MRHPSWKPFWRDEWRLPSETHVSGLVIPTQRIPTHFFVRSPFKLCYLDERLDSGHEQEEECSARGLWDRIQSGQSIETVSRTCDTVFHETQQKPALPGAWSEFGMPRGGRFVSGCEVNSERVRRVPGYPSQGSLRARQAWRSFPTASGC
jgi:hypothetical protein